MKKLLLLVFAVLVTSTAAFSQVEKGDINLSGNFTYTGIEGEGVGLFFAKGGYFFSQNIEAGASLQFIFAGGETGTGIGPYATYNFLTQDAKLLPYLGAQIQLLSFMGADINSAGIYGGSKYFVTEAVNIDGGISLQKGFGDFDGTIFTATIGIGFVLGKLK
jgi:hypothetical protein